MSNNRRNFLRKLTGILITPSILKEIEIKPKEIEEEMETIEMIVYNPHNFEPVVITRKIKKQHDTTRIRG